MSIKISENKQYFIKDNKKWFYLADTVWSTFTNTSLIEWEEYLDYRKMQGFNVLQINILPQWDRSEADLDIKPFPITEDGNYDYYSYNPGYFDRAVKMLEMAADRGFTPALVVLWLDFVKGTWASKDKEESTLIPLAAVEPYSEFIVKTFSRFDPIYIISGDTNFEEDIPNPYYYTALKTIKTLSPQSLATMHICGCSSELPECFEASPYLDFYMYQSCHFGDNPDMPYKLAGEFLAKEIKRPILNSEPCYEGHGYIGKYGRFNDFDVRKAVWQSLLSGAKAGIAYGAHGLWNFHKKGKKFISEACSGKPFDWSCALKFRGAWDTVFAKQVFEAYDLFDLKPSELLLNETPEIRMSADDSQSKFAIYVPYGADVKIGLKLQEFEVIIIDLKERKQRNAEVASEDAHCVIKMPDFYTDYLIIGVKK